jgi:PPE-repeat protein
MDFGALPPEITSALIHSGPGAGSLIEASVVWQRLGTELEEIAHLYASVVSSLTQAWEGPSSVAMDQAAEPYLSWLRTTAQQCRQLSSSTHAAAAAFNSTLSAVVPPAYVGANRVRMAQLLATNWFGVNLAAIAATEDEYEGMWANNSAAMYRYEAASAQALELPQFSSPPAVASPTAAAAQASAVTAAAAAGTPAASTWNIFAPGSNTIGTGLAGLLNVFSGSAGSSFGTLLNSNLVTTGIINGIVGSGFPIDLLSLTALTNVAQGFQAVGSGVVQGLAEGEAALGAPEAAGLTSALSAAGSARAATAAVGVGVSMGKLTMPPAVVGLLRASQAPVQLASAVSPLPLGEFGLPAIPMPPFMMPPPVKAGKRKREGRDYDDIEYGLELKGTFMTRPPSAG